MQFKATIGGQQVECEWTETPDGTVQAKVGDRVYSLNARVVQSGVLSVIFNNRSLEIAAVPNTEGYTVSIGQSQFVVETDDPRASFRRASRGLHPGTAEIKAPMPGKVVRLLVEQGAQVDAKQGLIVIEAMKMQNEIKSPKAGAVKAIHAAVGSTVNAGDLLATVE